MGALGWGKEGILRGGGGDEILHRMVDKLSTWWTFRSGVMR